MGFRGHIGKLPVALGVVALSLCLAHSALGATTQVLASPTSTGTFNLSSSSTWSPANVPTNGDNVFIGFTASGNGSAHNATFTNAASNVFVADSLTVSNAIGGNKGGALTVTFSGAAFFTSGVAQVNFYGGTTADASDTALTFSSNVTFGAMNFIGNSGDAGANATLTMAGASQGNSLLFNGGGTESNYLVISGPLGLTGTLTATNINGGSAGTISGNSTVAQVVLNNATVDSITITNSTMSITGAVASVAGGFTLANNGTIALSGGGGLIISNVAPLLNGTLNIGNQTVTGKTNWSNNGTVALANGFIVGNNLTNNTAGTLIGYGSVSNVVVNLGTILSTNNTLAFASNIVQSGTMTIGSGSTISLLGSGALTNNGRINLVGTASGGNNAILNLGTAALTNLANGTITGGGIIQNGSQVINLGTILATNTSVELQFTNASTFGNAGTIGAATGATLTFGTALTGSAIITNFGTINLTGGTLNSGNITNLAGGAILGGGAIQSASQVVNLLGGSILATSSVVQLQFTNANTVGNGGTMGATTGATLTFGAAGTAIITNFGTVSLSRGTLLSGNITNLASGFFGGTGVVAGLVVNQGRMNFNGTISNGLQNSGSFTLSDDTTVTSNIVVNSGGVLDLVGNNLTNNVVLTINSGGVLTNGGAANGGATVIGSVTNGGTVYISANTYFDGTVTNTGGFFFQGAVSNNLVNSGNGAVTLNNAATITQTANINGGTLNLNGQTMTNGLLLVNGTGAVTNSVAGATVNGGVSNANVVAVTANTFFNGPVTNTGAFFFQGAISNGFVNGGNGTVTLNNTATITQTAAINGGTLNLNGQTMTNGLLLVGSAGTVTNAVAGASVNGGVSNAGVIAVSQNTFFNGPVTNTGSFFFEGAISNNLDSSGTVVLNNAATITQTATINAGLFDLNGQNYSNGLMVLSGSGVLTSSVAGASFNGGLSNAATVAITPGVFFKGVITNTGTIFFNGGVLSNSLDSSGTVTLNNAATITGTASITGGLFDLNGQNYTNGLMVLSGSGVLTSSQAGATFNGGLSNAATVAITPGVFFNGLITNTGAIFFNGGALSNNLVSSGTVTLNNSATVTGSTAINGGTLNLNGQMMTNGLLLVSGTGVVTNSVAGATVNGGVNNANVIAVTANTFFNGIVTNTGAMFFQGAISNTLVNPGSFNLNNNATLTVAPVDNGTINVAARTLTVSPAWLNGGSLQISGGVLAGGMVTNNAGDNISGFGTISNAVVNSGLVTASGGTLTMVNAPTTQAGSGINVAGTGVLNVIPDWASSGTINIAAGGAISGGTLTNASATGTLSGSGFIDALVVNLGRMNWSGTISNGLLDSGSFTLADDATVTSNIVVNSGGVLDLVGNNLTNQAVLTISSGGVLTNGIAGGTVNGGVSNAGTIFITANTFFNGIVTNTGGFFFEGAISNNLVNSASGAVTLNNTATITQTAAINGGTLNLSGQTMTSGLLLVSGTGVVTNSIAGATVNGGVSNSGVIAVTANTFFKGPVTNTGTFDWQGAISNSFVSSGDVLLNGSATITGGATVNGGLFDLNGQSYTNSLMVLTGTGVLTSSVSGASFNGGLSNAATVAVSPGLFFKGIITNTGAIFFNGGALSNNLVSSGTVTLNNAATITGSTMINGGTLSLNGQALTDGVLVVGSAGTVTNSVAGAVVNGGVSNGGLIALTANTFFNGPVTNTGGLFFQGTMSNTFVNSANGTVTLNNTGTFTKTLTINSGTLNLNGGNLMNLTGLIVGGNGTVTNAIAGASVFDGFTNNATVAFTADTFLNGVVTNNGAFFFQGAISNTLDNTGSFNLNNNATITGAPVNSGTLNLANGTLNVTPAWANAGTILLSGGGLSGGNVTNNNTVVGSGSVNSLLVNNSSIFATNGILAANDGITNAAAGQIFLRSTGTLNGGTIINVGTIATLSGGNVGAAIINTVGGDIQGTNGTLLLNGKLTNLGSISIFGGATWNAAGGITNAAGADILLQNTGTLNGSTITNLGLIAAVAGGNVGAQVVNTGGGMILATNQTLNLSGGLVNQSLLQIGDGTANSVTATVGSASGGLFDNSGGEVRFVSSGPGLASAAVLVVSDGFVNASSSVMSNYNNSAAILNFTANNPVTNNGTMHFTLDITSTSSPIDTNLVVIVGGGSNTFYNNGTIIVSQSNKTPGGGSAFPSASFVFSNQFVNAGTMVITNTGNNKSRDLYFYETGGTVTNTATGSILMIVNGQPATINTIVQTGGFVNAGTFTFMDTPSTTTNLTVTLNQAGATFSNAVGGKVILGPGNQGTATINADNYVNAGTNLLQGGALLINSRTGGTGFMVNSGTILFSGGGLNVDFLTNTASGVYDMTVAGQTINNPFTIASFGTITTGGGTLQNSGTIDLRGGFLNGLLNNSAGALLSITNGTTTVLSGGILNGGAINLQSAGTLTGGAVTNQSGGVIAAVAGGNLGASVVNLAGGVIQATNQTLNLFSNLLNSGTIIVNAGKLNVTPAWVNSGTLTMGNGGTLVGGNLTNDVTIFGSGTISNLLVNAGAVTVTNGTLLVTTAPINTGSITVADGGAPGILDVVPAWTNAGFVSIVGGGSTTGGALTNLASGTVTNQGVINTFVANLGSTVLGGTISNSFLQTSGTTTVSGKGTITGSATVTGGLFNLNGGTYTNGLMVLGGAGVLTNAIAGGTFNGGLSNAATVAVTANTFFNGPVTNTGTFAFLGAVSNTLVNSGDVILNGSGTISGVLANSGSVNVNNGTLSLVVAPTQTGSITVTAGATLNAVQAWVNSGTITMLGGVVTNAAITNANFISGYGTIDGGGVVNNGKIFANASSISGIGTQTVRLTSFTNNINATIGTASSNGVLNILQASSVLINQGTVSLSGGTILFNGGAGTITNFNIIAGVGNVANFPIVNAGTLASFIAQAPISGLSNLIATIGVTNNGLLGANNLINGAATLSLTVSGGGSAIVNQGTVALQGGFLTVNGGAGVITNVNNGLVYGIGTQKLSVANLATGKIMASNGLFSLGLQSNANAGVLSNLNAVSTILLTNKFLVNTGTIVLNGGGLLLGGSVITNENSITGPGAISSSVYNDTAGMVLATNGVLNIATNAGESVQNLGLFTITGDGTLNVVPAWLNTNGTVNILGGVLAGGTATNAGMISGFGTISSLLVNQDLVTVSNGTLTVSTAPMLTSGGVSISASGVLDVIPSWASSGTIALAAGGAITGGTLTNASNNGTLSGSGFVKTLLVNQGRMNFGGTVSNNFVQTSGSFTLSGNATITGAATVSGGVVDLVGQHLTDSILAIIGSGVFTNGIAGGTVDGGVSNAATVAVTADTFFNGIITNTGSIFFQGVISNNVVNSGAFTLNNNATIATGALVNKGQVFVTNGTLDLVNAPTQNGTVSVANAATLDVVPAWRNGGGLNLLGGTVIGSTLTNAGIISGFGTISPSVLNNSGATITATSGGTLTLTAIPFQNGIVNILGTLNVASAWSNGSAGTVTMNGGTLTGGALQNLGAIRGFGTLNPNVSNNGQIIANNASQALVFNNSLANSAGGVVSANTGRMVINGVFTNAGTLSMINSIGTFSSAVVNSGAWVTDPTTNVFQNTYTVASSGFIQSSAGDLYIFSNNATTAASFINVSTNKTQYNTVNGDFRFASTLGVTQVFATAGHNFEPLQPTATNQIQELNPNFLSLPGYSNNFALGTLEISSYSTVEVDDAFITGGAGTDDNLQAALYLDNLDMGTDSLLIISTNVEVYFINSNNWNLANVQLQGNPNFDQAFDGIHQFVVVPEPSIVLLWLSSIATVYAARKRGAGKK